MAYLDLSKTQEKKIIKQFVDEIENEADLFWFVNLAMSSIEKWGEFLDIKKLQKRLNRISHNYE